MLYALSGSRKYLTISELSAFIRVAESEPVPIKALCLTLAFSGARISEVLGLTMTHIDMLAGVVIIECLKKRRRGIYRAVPIPNYVLRQLQEIGKSRTHQDRLWTWGRTTAWSHVKSVMKRAEIADERAMPKALRHAFGVGATQANVPLNILQKWMGHSRLATTTIYANAVGDEERNFAQRMWKHFLSVKQIHSP